MSQLIQPTSSRTIGSVQLHLSAGCIAEPADHRQHATVCTSGPRA